MATKVINISLPDKLLKEIDKAARRENRTRSEFLREAARRYIEAKKQPALATSWTREDRRAFASLADSALARIWDNEIDAVYDNWERKRRGKSKA